MMFSEITLVNFKPHPTHKDTMKALHRPYSWHPCACNSTNSDAVPITCLTVDITLPIAHKL